jgi:hypothetical protein
MTNRPCLNLTDGESDRGISPLLPFPEGLGSTLRLVGAESRHSSHSLRVSAPHFASSGGREARLTSPLAMSSTVAQPS